MEFKLRNKVLVIILFVLLAKISKSQLIFTTAGNGVQGFSGDGALAIYAQMKQATSVAVDASGNIYIADYIDSRIRKVSTSNIITTIAGTGTAGLSGDGGLAINAKLNNPAGISVDAAGNIYIADFSNNRIRKINTSGIISTIAGYTTAPGFSGDGGIATSAQLSGPNGVVADAAGNIFIADYYNNRIRKINTSGFINTIAGTSTAGYSGDGGPATAAKINAPAAIIKDATGNIYFAEYLNHCIRMIDPSGIISTFAGTGGVSGFSGDGGPAIAAKLFDPAGLIMDATGNMFIADSYNNRIRKVNVSGNISTICGTGAAGYSGDAGSASLAKIYRPNGVATDVSGNVFIADLGNYRVRVICLASCPIGTGTEFILSGVSGGEVLGVKLYPNPSNGIFNLQKDSDGDAELLIFNGLGQMVHEQKVIQGINSVFTVGLSNGLYSYILMQDYRKTGSGKLVIE